MSDLILLSGGLDSATLLADCCNAGTATLTVAVDYEQRHLREIDAAHDVAAHYGVTLIVLDLTDWGRRLAGSALTDRAVEVPHGHYADEPMRSTVVPNRNAVLLMAAAGIAVSHGLRRVLTAVHAGDRHIYRDCRPEFIDAINYTVGLATDEAVTIEAPFMYLDKTEIVTKASHLGVPIGLTWSCYEGGDAHCGLCGACYERQEAMRDAGVPDPTMYRQVAA
jgi:7-cyano-7-deazaguanine synthase